MQHRLSGLLIWMGLAPLGYQITLWLEHSRWTSFTILDLVLALGGERPYFPWRLVHETVSWILTFELTSTCLGLGVILALAPPLARLWRKWHGLPDPRRTKRATAMITNHRWHHVDFRSAS